MSNYFKDLYAEETPGYLLKQRSEWAGEDYAEALSDEKIKFDDIPDNLRISEVYQVAVSIDQNLFEKIPPERLDTEIRIKALGKRPSLFLTQHFSSKMCKDYYQIACAAVAIDAMNIYAVEANYIDRNLVSSAIMTQPAVVYHLWIRFEDLCKLIVDQEFVDQAVLDNPRCLSLPKDLGGRNYLSEFPVNDDILIQSIKQSPQRAPILAEIGREDLLSKMMESGYWPEHWHDIRQPQSLEQGIKFYVENVQSNIKRTYYKAFINQWSSSDVIPLMQHWTRKKHLPDLFPKEELFETFKDDPETVGKWFSTDLGL